MKELQCKATRYKIINTETGDTEAVADYEQTITGYLEACTAAERRHLIVRKERRDIPAGEWMIRRPSPQRHPWTVTVTRIEHLPNGQKSYCDPVTLKTRGAIPQLLQGAHSSAIAGQLSRYRIMMDFQAVNTLTPSYQPDDYPPPEPETEPADEGLEYYVDALDSAQPYDDIIDAMADLDAAISAGVISAEDVEVMEYQKVFRRMDYRQADHERQIMNYYKGDPDQYPTHPEYQQQIASSSD
ncbi:MAG: hypothetical protein OXG78_06955 [Chloroflexi bacterium]|nr:hypothetical protein [Chloroflexota bacterium]